MDNNDIKFAVILTFIIGILFIIVAIGVYETPTDTYPDNAKSYALALIGIATLITANIGATRIK